MGDLQRAVRPERAGVKPARLKIVKIDQPMTVSEFNSRYPSSIKPEQVALINGVEPDGKIQAGYAKQVVGGTPDTN